MRITITKDPGYDAQASVNGEAVTGAVSLSGDTLKIGDQSYKLGSMRIVAETPEASAPRGAAPRSGATTGTTGGPATPAADGGNAPTR